MRLLERLHAVALVVSRSMGITVEIRRPGWMTPRRLRRARPLVLLLALVFAGPVLATDRFDDVFDTNPHHDDISAIAAVGITQGCNPPTNDLYCPEQVVTRQQMGSFLARTAGLGTNPPVTNADKLDGMDSADFYADGAKVADSELLDGLDSAALQRRVTGTCVAGSAIRVVNANGTVTCEADDDTIYTGAHPIEISDNSIGLSTERCGRGDVYKFAIEDEGWSCAADDVDGGNAATLNGLDSSAFARAGAPAGRPGFALSTLDGTGDVGAFASIIIGTDGLGLISYRDATNADLKVAHCADVACRTATTATLDSTGDVGRFTSITIGADGLGLISYYDDTNDDLKVAHCANTACSTASTATLDSAGDVGWYTSITIGADGLGLVSYFDAGNADLKVAHCANTACSTASSATVDSFLGVGQHTSISIGADGLGLISYYHSQVPGPRVAHCADSACSTASGATLDSTGSVGGTSITIGADGLGLISYYDQTNGNLKVAHCSNAACNTGITASTLDSTGVVGQGSSITIGADGRALITYYDSTNQDLKVAHCADVTCTTASSATLDSTGNVGLFTSITIGADGLGLISYYDATNGDLKVAHLSNRLGLPWHRPR